MTGLDIEKDRIIEMACLITDSDLNILAEVGTRLAPPGFASRVSAQSAPGVSALIAAGPGCRRLA